MRSAVSVVLASLVSLACGVDAPCDSGQEHRNGFCVDSPASTGGAAGSPAKDTQGGTAGSAQAQGGAAGSGVGAAGGADGGQLGDECASDNECGPEAHYCAINPGDPLGYCTPTGCDEDPSLCPSDQWTCEDEYMAFGYPSFCWPN